jgi:hypothetical protein
MTVIVDLESYRKSLRFILEQLEVGFNGHSEVAHPQDPLEVGKTFLKVRMLETLHNGLDVASTDLIETPVLNGLLDLSDFTWREACSVGCKK